MMRAIVERPQPTSIVERGASDMEPTSGIPLRLLRSAPSAVISGVGSAVSLEALRHAALRLDGVARALRETDANRALLLWEGLVCGGLTLVDWFDANDRRFILVKLNDRKGSHSCGLTTREHEVAVATALGESSKLTGYRLGISPSRVSTLLKGVQRKLGVRTKAQLVIMVRLLENHDHKVHRSADQGHRPRKEGDRPWKKQL
jgi:DNA-binding CsgD family transcriptional regulator